MIDVQKNARPCILTRKPYIPGKPIEEVQREYGLSDIIKLASNENPLGASPKAVVAMVQELSTNINLYPESLCPTLVKKLSQIHDVPVDHFFVDNGEDSVITMLGLTFLEPDDEVIMSDLTFPAYEGIVGKMGAKAVFVPLTEDYRNDIPGIIEAITPKTKMIFLCNPNNPTGTINTQEEFHKMLRAVPEQVMIVSDEAYYEFADNPKYPQTVPYLRHHSNIIILRTFSKVYGLAGVRIGYAMAHPDIVNTMLKVREPFPVNRIAQAGALAALDDEEFIQKTLDVNAAGRAQLTEGLKAMGFKVAYSQSNFIMVDIGRPSTPVYQELLKEGIIIRPLAPQGAPTCLRISIGTAEQNERLLVAIENIFQKIAEPA